MNYLEIAGTVVGLIYLYLEYKANVWLWAAGLVMPVIYLFVYWDAGLYADFAISIYYLLASAYGVYCWLRGTADNQKTLPISRTPRRLYMPLALIFIFIFVLIGFLLLQFTDSTVPWADAFTTALSIVAMWMLARKYLEQWLVWIAADLGCAILYAYKELWFTGALYFLYAAIAVFGYRKWRKTLSEEGRQAL